MKKHKGITLIVHESIEQEFIDKGGQVPFNVQFLDQKSFTRMIGKNSVELSRALLITKDGASVIEQPAIGISNNLYWLVQKWAENDKVIVKPSFEDNILKIEAFKKIDNERVVVDNYKCELDYTGFRYNNDTFSIIIENNQVTQQAIDEAASVGVLLENVDGKIKIISPLKDFQLNIKKSDHEVFLSSDNFVNGNAIITQ